MFVISSVSFDMLVCILQFISSGQLGWLGSRDRDIEKRGVLDMGNLHTSVYPFIEHFYVSVFRSIIPGCDKFS